MGFAMQLTDEMLYKTLKEAKNIAIVGASNNRERASNGIMKFLMKNNYNCFPVNPNEEEVLGVKAYKTLSEVPEKIDIVDVFRRSEAAADIVREAAALNPGFIWLQENVYSEDAENIASKNNIPIIMDKCIFKELLRLKVLN